MGAVGLLRLSGTGSLSLAGSFVAWKAPPEPRRAALAQALAEGRPLDRVLLTYFPGPRSYTGEDVVEISAHGSPYILGRLLEEAVRSGARLAEPGEFTRRAYANGRLDLAQAEAVAALVRARTRAAHENALAQLEGRLSREVSALRRETLSLLAEAEAALDHPEEDIPLFDREAAARRLESLRAKVDSLAGTHARGQLLCEGARVAVVGRPNAGKSSLLNALLGRERSIVSRSPGTTRDTVEAEAELGGLPAVLIDTAGLRDTAADPIEREGMERSRRALASCDLALFVQDRSRPAGGQDEALWAGARRALKDGVPAVLVLNKSDLADRLGPAGPPWPRAEVCALTGEGVAGLADLAARLLKARPPEDDGAVVTAVRHRRCLEEASAALARARGALASLASEEIVALHLREALSSMSAIAGETAADEVLREVFSRFCIGK